MMLTRRTANWITQKGDALARRFRLARYRLLGVRISGDAHLRRISIPRNFHDIEIAAGAALDDGTTLIVSGEPTGSPKIRIGAKCYINRYTIIDASLSVEVGEAVMVGPHCYITDHDHGTSPDRPIAEQPLSAAPTRIGRDAWLGAHVTVLKGVEIGDGAIVGAGAVVTKSIPPGKIAVGVPARVIGDRA